MPVSTVAADLFSEQCTACHALDVNKYGPELGGVFGRRAGAAPGYDYSPALRSAGLTWSADNLNRWLAGPKEFIPGVKMPVSVPDPIARRDIVAYLRQQSAPRGGGIKAKTAARGTGY